MINEIKDLISEMQMYMKKKDIKLIANIGKLPIIETDPDRVMQVLRNLLHNAYKFSPQKSTIQLKVKNKKSFIEFSVVDHGIGIQKDNLQRIFEPFFQEEKTLYRRYGGTGLGLAICKGIVESQHGTLFVKSEKNKGSTFTFTIPHRPERDIRSIQLMFSSGSTIKRKIKELLTDTLGPMAVIEYMNLEATDLSSDHLNEYAQKLYNKGIIDQTQYQKIIKELNNIFNHEH